MEICKYIHTHACDRGWIVAGSTLNKIIETADIYLNEICSYAIHIRPNLTYMF